MGESCNPQKTVAKQRSSVKTLALAILLFAAIGCSREMRTSNVTSADDDLEKQLARLRSTIPFKPYEEKYADGKLKERGRGRFLGIVCGRPWTEYDGLFEGWYDSGVKECEMHYKDGNRDGVALNWFPNGKKKYSVTWRKGKRDGDFTVFYDSEVISAKGRFKEESLVQADFFDREGKPITRDQWLQIPRNRSFWN